MSIRLRLTVVSLLCAVVPLAMAVALADYSARAALEQQIQNDLLSGSRDDMARAETVFAGALQNLVTWSGQHAMQDVLTGDEAGDIKTEIRRLAAAYPVFAELVAVDEHGAVAAASRDDTVTGGTPVSGLVKTALQGQLGPGTGWQGRNSPAIRALHWRCRFEQRTTKARSSAD